MASDKYPQSSHTRHSISHRSDAFPLDSYHSLLTTDKIRWIPTFSTDRRRPSHLSWFDNFPSSGYSTRLPSCVAHNAFTHASSLLLGTETANYAASSHLPP